MNEPKVKSGNAVLALLDLNIAKIIVDADVAEDVIQHLADEMLAKVDHRALAVGYATLLINKFGDYIQELHDPDSPTSKLKEQFDRHIAGGGSPRTFMEPQDEPDLFA